MTEKHVMNVSFANNISGIYKELNSTNSAITALRLYRCKRIKENTHLKDEIRGNQDLANDPTTKKM